MPTSVGSAVVSVRLNSTVDANATRRFVVVAAPTVTVSSLSGMRVDGLRSGRVGETIGQCQLSIQFSNGYIATAFDTMMGVANFPGLLSFFATPATSLRVDSAGEVVALANANAATLVAVVGSINTSVGGIWVNIAPSVGDVKLGVISGVPLPVRLPGESFLVPLRIPTTDGLLGTFEVFVAYDSRILRVVEVVPAAHVVATIDTRGSVGGVARLVGTATASVAAPSAITEGDVVCQLRFVAIGSGGSSRIAVNVSALIEADGSSVPIRGMSVASALVQRVGQAATDGDAVALLNNSFDAFPSAPSYVCNASVDSSCAITIADIDAVARVLRRPDVINGDLSALDVDGNSIVDERDVVASVNAYLGLLSVLRFVRAPSYSLLNSIARTFTYIPTNGENCLMRVCATLTCDSCSQQNLYSNDSTTVLNIRKKCSHLPLAHFVFF